LIRDPLARLAVVGCISFGTLGHTPLWYAVLACGAYACWTIAERIPFPALLTRLRGALLFLVLIVFLNAVTEGGRVVFETGGLYVTAEGLAKGGEQALRLCTVIWGALILFSTGSIEEYQDAAERWTRRKGRPLLAAGTIALTYLPLLVESARRVTIARRARGEIDRIRFPGGIGQAAAAALPLFAAALRNSDALAEAMESRCYNPSSARTPFRLTRFRGRDAAIVTAVVLFTAAAIAGIA
jgi:energy-coupling factor transport system permease protein